MRRIARATVLAGALVVGAGCWPVPGQNADRTGSNGLETRLTVDTVGDLEEAWTFVSGGVAMLDPVTSSGGVHATLENCGLVTLSPATGAQRWFYDAGACQGGPSPAIRESTAPSVVGREVLFGFAWAVSSIPSDRWGWSTHAVDAVTGDVRRTDDTAVVAAARGNQGVLGVPQVFVSGGPPFKFQNFGPPAVFQVGSLDNPAARRAVHVASGAPGPLFESGTPTRGAGAVFHAGTGVMSAEPGPAQPAGRAVRAFSATEARPGCAVTGGGGSGTTSMECPLWVRPVEAEVTTAPVVDNGRGTVFVGTQGGTVLALDAATGAVRWSAALGTAVTATPALAGGTLFVPVAGGRLVALPAAGCGAATCTPSWTAPTDGEVAVQPAAAGGVVYTGAADGSVRAFAAAGCGAATCAAIWSDEAGSEVTGAPAVSNGQLYVGLATGLVAYGLP